jgi:hypothetical protein
VPAEYGPENPPSRSDRRPSPHAFDPSGDDAIRVDRRRVYAVGGSMGGQETLPLIGEIAAASIRSCSPARSS